MADTKFVAVALILAAASLSACSTVKMPDLGLFSSSSQFEEEAKNISDYPDVADAPAAPTGIKSAKYWDREAQKLINERDNFSPPAPVDATRTDAEIARDLEELKAKVNAYKADDPQ